MRYRIVSFIVCVMSFVAGVGIAAIVSGLDSHLPDSTLMRRFQTNRSEFDLVVRMANEDSHAQPIAYTYVAIKNDKGQYTYWHEDQRWPNPEATYGFTKERWDKYRAVFNRLDIRHGLDRQPEWPGAIFMTTSFDSSDLDGSETADTEKGYVYSPTEINSNVVDSLDGINVDHPTIYFRKLEDHWYLYYQWSVGKPE